MNILGHCCSRGMRRIHFGLNGLSFPCYLLFQSSALMLVCEFLERYHNKLIGRSIGSDTVFVSDDIKAN